MRNLLSPQLSDKAFHNRPTMGRNLILGQHAFLDSWRGIESFNNVLLLFHKPGRYVTRGCRVCIPSLILREFIFERKKFALFYRVRLLFCLFRPVNDNRASLLRSSAPAKKPLSEGQRDSYVNLWKNQIKLAMRLIPPVMPTVTIRCASPDLSLR